MKITPFSRCTQLPMLENAVLWSLRSWVIGQIYNQEVATRIAELYQRLDAPVAADFLDGFMLALNYGTSRTLAVNCVCHPDLSDDEAALLNIIALEQHGNHDAAYDLLAGMTVTEPATAAGCTYANRLALALADAGHIFTLHGQTMPMIENRAFLRDNSRLVSLSVH